MKVSQLQVYYKIEDTAKNSLTPVPGLIKKCHCPTHVFLHDRSACDTQFFDGITPYRMTVKGNLIQLRLRGLQSFFVSNYPSNRKNVYTRVEIHSLPRQSLQKKAICKLRRSSNKNTTNKMNNRCWLCVSWFEHPCTLNKKICKA